MRRPEGAPVVEHGIYRTKWPVVEEAFLRGVEDMGCASFLVISSGMPIWHRAVTDLLDDEPIIFPIRQRVRVACETLKILLQTCMSCAMELIPPWLILTFGKFCKIWRAQGKSYSTQHHRGSHSVPNSLAISSWGSCVNVLGEVQTPTSSEHRSKTMQPLLAERAPSPVASVWQVWQV